MKDQDTLFKIEDWVVHRQFGVGQIREIEVKLISGEETKYYRVEGLDSTTYWVPVNDIDEEQLRPLSKEEELEQAILVLQKPPKKMAKNHISRKNRIKNVRLGNKTVEFARLIRDLRGRRRTKRTLNRTERSALDTFTKRLAREWSVIRDKDLDVVETRIEKMLQED